MSASRMDRAVGRAGTSLRYVPATRGSPKWHDLRRFSSGAVPAGVGGFEGAGVGTVGAPGARRQVKGSRLGPAGRERGAGFLRCRDSREGPEARGPDVALRGPGASCVEPTPSAHGEVPGRSRERLRLLGGKRPGTETAECGRGPRTTQGAGAGGPAGAPALAQGTAATSGAGAEARPMPSRALVGSSVEKVTF